MNISTTRYKQKCPWWAFCRCYLYIDCAHSFDSVVHSKLIFKLSTFGIAGNLLNWIAAFLNYHFQRVVVEHCNSEWLPVLSGIPQATVLGSVLFILFIEDIGVICSGSVTHTFLPTL